MKLKKVLAVALAGVLTLGALSGCGTDKSTGGDTGNDTSGKPLAGKHFTIAISRTELAEYLSADRTALARELNHMKEEGLIDVNRNSFTIF